MRRVSIREKHHFWGAGFDSHYILVDDDGKEIGCASLDYRDDVEAPLYYSKDPNDTYLFEGSEDFEWSVRAYHLEDGRIITYSDPSEPSNFKEHMVERKEAMVHKWRKMALISREKEAA